MHATDTDDFEYDVALSFAGQDRKHAEALASLLKARSVKVFYDADEKATLWGEDLYVHLPVIYSKKARFCVIFVSASYAEEVWTHHERQAAQERALREKGNAYILPIRVDQTSLPGLPETTAYVDISDGIPAIAGFVIAKIEAARPTEVPERLEQSDASRTPPPPSTATRPGRIVTGVVLALLATVSIIERFGGKPATIAPASKPIAQASELASTPSTRASSPLSPQQDAIRPSARPSATGPAPGPTHQVQVAASKSGTPTPKPSSPSMPEKGRGKSEPRPTDDDGLGWLRAELKHPAGVIFSLNSDHQVLMTCTCQKMSLLLGYAANNSLAKDGLRESALREQSKQYIAECAKCK